MQQQSKKSSMLRKTFSAVPQQLKNIKKCSEILEEKSVQDAIEKGHETLNGIGRLFIRPSGTEDLIRVMVEADEKASLDEVMSKILQAIDAA